MKKCLILTLIFCYNLILGQTPTLFVPKNFKNAMKNGTRTNYGKPGPNYWQNRSEYKINVELLPDSSYLIGNEVVNYFNNSPDSLNEIVIRLYQNISRKGSVRDWYIGEEGFNEGVKLKYLVINGDTINTSPVSRAVRIGSTNLFVKTPNKIAPGSKTEIKIGWEFEIQKVFKLRMGNYGDGNFYIAYWYPQIAVYDDIDGWDDIDYSGMVEFYNDFSNYDVNIKVPGGMVVWATGDLQNGEQVLRKDIFDKYEKAKKSDETINIIGPEDYTKGIITAENEFNEWHFIAKNTTDFSFATSKSFNWDGVSTIVDQNSGRRALADAVYADGTIHYHKAAEYSKATINYLSKELPGFPYPYSHATAYCNGNYGGGMESPMMANNGAPSVLGRHVGLIFHEIAHNYFPFIMGTNERKYAWMDEGWAAFLPTKLVNKIDPDYDYIRRRVADYESKAGKETDLPLITPSYSYKTDLTRLGFYDRPANAYYELQELLGVKLFKEALLQYMDTWNGKHPIPLDFFYIFNDAANEDLSWFWKPWFYEYGYPDLSIKSVDNSKGTIKVKIEKLGNIPTRVKLILEFDDGTIERISKSSRIWKDGNKTIDVSVSSSKKLKIVTLGNKYIPDVDRENNVFEL